MTEAILRETHTLPGTPPEYADRLYTDFKLMHDAHQQAGRWFKDHNSPQGRTVGNAIRVDYDNRAGVAAMRFTFRPQPGGGTRVDAECFYTDLAEHYRRLLDLLGVTTAQPAAPPQLTRQEEKIANFLADGLDEQRILIRLNVQSIRTHLKNIRGKWGMKGEQLPAMQEKARAWGYGGQNGTEKPVP